MSNERRYAFLGTAYEERIGFARAVRVGSFIAVGGTAPIGHDGETVGIGDAAAQARRCFEIIEQALAMVGAGLEHVVRTRTFLTDVTDFEAVAEVRKEFVGTHRPVDTIVQIARFVNPGWLVEIEVDAVAPAATA